MKILLISSLISLIACKSFAQQKASIKGRIFEQSTKQPIIGATIAIKDGNFKSSTDSLGSFSLTGVPEGTYTLLVSSIAFLPKVITDVTVTRNKTFYLEAEMVDEAIKMDNVVIQAFRNENNPLTPVSSYSFGREEIFRSPGAQGDIFRAIGILPGVSSAGGQFSAIAVRGQGVRDNVYMVDDMPVFDVSHLSGSGSFNDPNGGRFSIFAPLTIDNATFQGGGFGAQYGRRSSAYLGLGIKEGNQVSASLVGQFDLLGGTLIYDGPSYFHKKTSVLATARYQNFSLLKSVVGLEGIGLPSFGDYMLKTTTQINLANKLSFVAMYNPESYVKTIEDVLATDTLQDASIGKGSSSKALIGVNLRSLIGKSSFIKNVVYFRGIFGDDAFGTSYPTVNLEGKVTNGVRLPYNNKLTALKNNQREVGYRSIFTSRSNKKLLSGQITDIVFTAGVDLARIDMDYTRSAAQPDTGYIFTRNDSRPSANQKYVIVNPENFNARFKGHAYNASAYLDYSLKLFDKLTLNPGLRYDYTGFSTEHNFSPRLSGSLALTQTQTLNFAAGIFYQDPLLEDVADQSTSGRLKNEKTTQFILGYKKYFSEDLKFIVETWYKEFDKLSVRPQSGQVLLNNNGYGHAYGADINITKRLSKKYFGQVGYSYMQSKRNDGEGLGIYDFTYSQPHLVSLLASYKPNDKWVFSTKLRYATGRPRDSYVIHNNVFNDLNFPRSSLEVISQNSLRLKDYLSWDLRADYREQVKTIAMTLFANIVNLPSRFNESAQLFQPITGKVYYDGATIFPTFGLRIEL